MASQNKIVEIIFGIKTIYPYYAKETDVESLVKTWGMLLSDIPDDVAEKAFYKALRVCKVPPTPADIIEHVNAMQKTNEPTPEELWVVYNEALTAVMRLIPQFEYTYIDETGISQGQRARNKVDEIWNNLPEQIRSYLASRGELVRNARQLASVPIEETRWEKQRFMKTLPQIIKRTEYSGLMITGGGVNLLDRGE